MKLMKIWVTRDDYLAWQSRVGALCKLQFFLASNDSSTIRKISHEYFTRPNSRELFMNIEILFVRRRIQILFVFIGFLPLLFFL